MPIRTSRSTPLLALLTLIIAAQFASPAESTGAPAAQPTTIVLVRHAEKEADGGRNPRLTEAGLARAAALVHALEHAELAAVYSTDLCRTATTADPVAQGHDLPLHVQRLAAPDGDLLSDCTPAVRSARQPLPKEIATTADLSRHLREQHAGDVVLVVGHSNTIPEIVAALRAQPTGLEISDDDYDDLFVVELRPSGATSLIRAAYGAPTPTP